MNSIEQWIAAIRKNAYYFKENEYPPDTGSKVEQHLASFGQDVTGALREWIYAGVWLIFDGDPWVSSYALFAEFLLSDKWRLPSLEGGEADFLRLGSCGSEPAILLALDGTNRIFGEGYSQVLGTVAVPVGSFEEFMKIVLEDIELGVKRVAFAKELEGEFFEEIEPWRVPRELHPRTFSHVVDEIVSGFDQSAGK